MTVTSARTSASGWALRDAVTATGGSGLVTCATAWEYAIDATAIQCWTALEEFYGIVPCTLMSMMSDTLRASACETDVAGTVSMYAMQLASGTPSALLDWNNNYGGDPDKAVVFHCSNLPNSVFAEQKMDYQEIIAGTVGNRLATGRILGD